MKTEDFFRYLGYVGIVLAVIGIIILLLKTMFNYSLR